MNQLQGEPLERPARLGEQVVPRPVPGRRGLADLAQEVLLAAGELHQRPSERAALPAIALNDPAHCLHLAGVGSEVGFPAMEPSEPGDVAALLTEIRRAA